MVVMHTFDYVEILLTRILICSHRRNMDFLHLAFQQMGSDKISVLVWFVVSQLLPSVTNLQQLSADLLESLLVLELMTLLEMLLMLELMTLLEMLLVLELMSLQETLLMSLRETLLVSLQETLLVSLRETLLVSLRETLLVSLLA